MVISAFHFTRIPEIVFGRGALADLGRLLHAFGSRVLLITGARSLETSGRLSSLLNELRQEGLEVSHFIVEGEPTPERVDDAVSAHRDRGVDVVAAVGGGSVLDAGKAVSAMLLQEGSVKDFLEGVGTGAVHDGRKVPFVAVPTTAGTGSEATKNAVLSRVGPDGFKKSLRHDNFVPDVALLDPELAVSCPPQVTAACGLDALTQLLESYVSTNASPMTDALALSGLELAGGNLVRACTGGAWDVEVRAGMACAALMSGMTLANAGLGLVHGLASAVGGLVEIPHGVVCGTLMGAANAATIRKLKTRHGIDHPALRKYARVGALFAGREGCDVETGCGLLVEKVNGWTESLKVSRLGAYGVRETDLDAIASGAGNKYNPVPLDPEEIRAVVRSKL
jgi:alcohol dehydrogenase